jgi:hypothetical protein
LCVPGQLHNFLLALIHLAYAHYIDRAITRHLPSLTFSVVGKHRDELLHQVPLVFHDE